MGSTKELLHTIYLFPLFSCLKPNLSNCEVAGIGLLKGVKVAARGIKSIDLTKDAIKILGFFFRIKKYWTRAEFKKKNIVGIEKVSRMWRQRSLTLKGKIITSKYWFYQKIVFLAYVLLITNEITITIQRIQREFLWNSNNVKIKRKLFAMIFKM